MVRKTLLSWSSGKDSAWALHVLRSRPDIEVAGLFTTVNREFDRVAMHAVRLELLQEQARCLGLPLRVIEIPYPCSNGEYESAMSAFIAEAKAGGIERMAFGDLFLEDIRAYREEKLEGTGIEPVFPLWEIPTEELSRRMVEYGLRAHVTCVDPAKLSSAFAGREYDRSFLEDLPDTVDPCGENGEFHSFVFDGPMFTRPVNVAVGECVERGGFVFADLILA